MASKVDGLIEYIKPGGSSAAVHAIASTAYGYCETDADKAAKTVDMTGFKLEEGVTIHVKFKNSNSASNPTLNVNGTGAHAITQYGTTANGTASATSGWYAGAVISLTYDSSGSGYWVSTAATIENQAANTVFAGPTSGNDTIPTFRSLIAADLPTVTVAKGGTNKTSWTQYAIPYLSATTTFGEIAPNKTTTTKFLSMTGTGSAGDAPVWVELSIDNIPNLTKSKITDFSHEHGNITNSGTIKNGNNDGNGNRLLYSDNSNLIAETGHYASSTKIAINSTTAPSQALYVNGTTYLNGSTTLNGNLNIEGTGPNNDHYITWTSGTYRQRIQIEDNSSAGDEVFTFQQSTNSGSTYTDLFTVKDNGTVIAKTFFGSILKLNQNTAENPTSTSNARIEFNYNTNYSQQVYISYTPSDGYRAPAGLKILGNGDTTYGGSSPAWLEVEGSIFANGGANKGYRVPHTGNTSGSVGGTTTPVYVDAGEIKAGNALGTMAYETATDYATVTTVNGLLSAANALVYKGVRAGATTDDSNAYGALTPAADCGDTYKVSVAGFINGLRVEVGDMLICTTDNTPAATDSGDTIYTTIRNNWNIIQTSEGTVSSSSTSTTDKAIARFDGTTGKIIQESNVTINDDGKITAPHTQNKTDGIHFTYDSNINFFVGVDSGNTNHGIYDTKASKWILSATATNHNWQLNGNAATATTLATARELYVDLATVRNENSPVTFDGSANKILHISGILGTDNGGTGTNATPTAGGIIYGTTNNSKVIYACTSAGTSGQVIISKGTDTPEWYTGLTLLSTTTESNDTSITTYEAIFGGTVTATTYYGALEQRSSTDNVARSVWFSYYDNNAVQDGVLAKDSDFTYNPSTNVLSIGTLTITGGTTNSALSSTGELSISSGTNKVMSINSGSTLTLDSATNTAITFSKNGTAAWSFIADGTAIQPETPSAINLGSTTNRWGALYVGSSDDYGDEYTPVYWNNGLPTASYPVQYFTWTINSGKTGVVLTHDALTEDTFPLTIVVTSGEEDLTGPITWNNAKSGNNNQFELSIPSALPSGKTVSGYCIVAHGTAITPTSTDIPSSST